MQAFSRLGRVVAVAVALTAWISACSLVVDFDRSKIHGSASGGKAGRPGTGGAGGMTAAGGTAGKDGGPGGAGMGGTAGDAGGDAPGPACNVTTHAGCEADELCCDTPAGPACRKTSIDECESCGTACPSDLATSCAGRSCQCEPSSGRACSGKDTELHCMETSTGASRCVECRDVTDCAKTAGKSECVNGQCAACDPNNQNAGCSGATPICDATTKTCKKCSTTKNDCPGKLVCTSSGACGGCATSADCVTPTTPICNSKTQCEGCSSNQQCMSELGLPYCVDAQRCSPCDPTSEAGCNDPAKPDCRQTGTSDFACQACTADAHCQNRAGTTVCDTGTGHCVECAADADCTGDPKKPLCVGNVCVPCDTSSIASTANDRCSMKPGGAGACVTSGPQQGTCGACNPSDMAGCSSSNLCCENNGVPACVGTSPSQCTACGTACSTTLANGCSNRGCVCGSGAQCSGTGTEKFCSGSPGTCVECRDDGDCGSAAPLCEGGVCVGCDNATNADARCLQKSSGTPACSRKGALKGKCADCDPSGTGTGCGGSSQCDSATATCVDCVDDSGCSGTNDKCNTTTHKCVDCTPAGGCLPATPVCDTANVCRGCQSDDECAASVNADGPLCGSNSTCAADAICTSGTDCTDGVHGQCVDVSGVLRCRHCNPADDAGCTAGEHCSADYKCL